MTDEEYSHVAFSDESRHNVGRFRSVAVLTCERGVAKEVKENIWPLIQNGNLKEFKWCNLRQARDRFVALKLIDTSIGELCSGHIRIDVLVWDTQDSRHLIANRDDVANLHRMYYHLLRNVMRLRWSNDAVWMLHPDEHSSMDWDTLTKILGYKSYTISYTPRDIFTSPQKFAMSLKREFGIHGIRQVRSHEEPLCQIADLFAGIGAYSYSVFDRYSHWITQNQSQIPLAFDKPQELKLTNSERERFVVLKTLSESCKSQSLGVGLVSSSGLRTYKPSYPLNFWKYEPQSDSDKAPTRNAATA